MIVLIVEDSERLASFMRKGLQEAGFTTDLALDGEEALHMAMTGAYDVIILDLMLPKRSGFDVIRHLRSKAVHTPVICVTARDQLQDKVGALNLGADDYLVKPFEFAELIARVRALRRRAPHIAPQKLTCADLELDPATREVQRAGQRIDLTSKEFALLEYLMRNAGRVVSRTMILEHVWDYNFDPGTNVVDVHICRLRDKIDKGFETKLIHTIRGVGYAIRPRS